MEDSENSSISTRENIKKIVKCILNFSCSKLPIKRNDIVTSAVGGNIKQFNEAFATAKEILLEIYGLAIHEVPETKSSKIYITNSTVESTSILEYTAKQKSEIILLFLVLSYVFMKGEPVNEEAVFSYLKKLKIPLDEPDENFPFSVKKVISETFVKQLYLKRDKIQSVTSNEIEFCLSWNYRSHLEFSKKNILNVVASILQKPTVCFVRQHSEVEEALQNSHIEIMEVE